ncbi:MAG: hypothetical protein MUP15_04725 [Dehalococcoidia bacterium]|nr:hypothetical protein [Dehalococcoidia bacterium]
MKEGISAARHRLIRDAVIYTPVLVVVVAVWGASLAAVVSAGGGGGIFLLLLLTIVVFLAGFQSIQSLRDLRSSPVTSEGPVIRKWRRAEFLLFPAYYLYVNRNVFRVPPLSYREVEQGDVVAVTHYPHTATVIEVKRIRRGEPGA